MFTAKVYRVAIPSSGIILKEDQVAYETIARWSIQSGEKNGIVLLPIHAACAYAVPDIYIFNIDNYVEATNVESAIETGALVALFFKESHDSGNTILGELKAVEQFKETVRDKCSCYEYHDDSDYQNILNNHLERLVSKA